MELTERQLQILKSAIEKYITTGEPVGSENLVEEQNFRFSPATARNELASLMREGFMLKPHTSSGRVPTTLGLRYYLTHLLEEEALSVLQEVAFAQKIQQSKPDFYAMLRAAALVLAEASNQLALVTTDSGFITAAGGANLLSHPEFWDMSVTRAVLDLLDRHEILHELFGKVSSEGDVHVLIGGELGISDLDPVGVVFTRYQYGNKGGFAGVVGTNRMPYFKTIPQVRYVSKLLSETGKNGMVANGKNSSGGFSAL